MEPDPLVGRTLGKCRIEALIGKGGMGLVYRAHHLPLDRPVALKVIAPDYVDTEAACAAFLREARIAARLQDPRIVQVYDVGREDGLTFIVMQLLDGRTLQNEVAENGPLAQREAWRVIREAVLALRTAHREGVVHRDVKPGNIMLGPDGAVRLMDFGLSLACDGRTTAPEGLCSAGSFDFMAPEQGFGVLDARMDLYAVGGTYFYALAGHPPYPGGSAADAMLQHRDSAVPDVRQSRPDTTPAAAELIKRLMAKDPARRPASAEELLSELESHRLLLDVDSSGSPFVLKPPPAALRDRFDPGDGMAPAGGRGEEPAAAPRAVAPAAAPPVPALVKRGAWGPRLAAAAVFLLLFGRHWLRASAGDWAAAGLFLAAAAASAAIRPRSRPVWTRAAAAGLAAAGMLAALYRYGFGSFAAPALSPALETLVVCGMGLSAALAGLYLGLHDDAPSDRPAAFGLLAAGALLLLLAAASLRMLPGMGLVAGLRSVLAADWTAFLASGGPWRWAGVLLLCALWLALRRRGELRRSGRLPVANWNK
ncbi:MAG: serine/threonine-protein kinase [Elusimicrobia bacterium]|nr:serine/threonine-protein kinase [Elusimicrobiota bacterium]